MSEKVSVFQIFQSLSSSQATFEFSTSIIPGYVSVIVSLFLLNILFLLLTFCFKSTEIECLKSTRTISYYILLTHMKLYIWLLVWLACRKVFIFVNGSMSPEDFFLTIAVLLTSPLASEEQSYRNVFFISTCEFSPQTIQ